MAKGALTQSEQAETYWRALQRRAPVPASREPAGGNSIRDGEMGEELGAGELVTCPECKGRGMIRPEGEWTNETCPTCNGRGKVPADTFADPTRNHSTPNCRR